MASTSTAQGQGAVEEEATLDHLLTRLALTEENKLEKVLMKLLPLIIGRLQSPHSTTKKKVLEMLSHINKRVKGQSHIKLPWTELLAMYRDDGNAPIVKNFAIVYLEMALERVPAEERVASVPSLLDGLSGKPAQHQEMLLQMAVEGLQQYGSERGVVNEGLPEKFAFVKKPADRDIFLEFCRQFVIFQPASISVEGNSLAPPGLSLAQAKKVAGKRVLSAQELGKRKLAIINVLAALDLAIESLYPILLIASIDSDSRVSRRGEELLKRRAGNADLENVQLIRRLFSIFQGTAPNINCADDERVSPASPSLKARLMATLTRSIVAANEFPSTLHAVFDCVYGPNTTIKLKQAGMEFAVWIFRQASDAQLKAVAPVILTGLLKALNEGDPNESDNGLRQLRGFTFQAVSQLAQRTPHLVSGNTTIAKMFFSALKSEPASVRSTVQEGLSSLAAAYQKCSAEVLKQLEGVLLENAEHADAAARFCAVQWSLKLYPFSHVGSRYICILGAGDSKLEIRDLAERGLDPSKEQLQGAITPSSGTYPSFSSMIEYVVKKLPRALLPARQTEPLLLPSKTFLALVQFLRLCRDAEAEGKRDKSLPVGEKSAAVTHGSDAMEGSSSHEEAYPLLLEHALVREGTSELSAAAAESLLAYASSETKAFASAYRDRTDWMKQLLKHIDAGTRTVAAKLLGITTMALTSSEAATLIQELSLNIEAAATAKFEETHGNICAAGYVIAQCMTNIPSVPGGVLQTCLAAIFRSLGHKDGAIGAACAEAFGSIGLRGPLPLPLRRAEIGDSEGKGTSSGEKMEGNDKRNMDTNDSEASVASDRDADVTRDGIIKGIADLLRSKEVRIVQKAVTALGHVGFGDDSKYILGLILDSLFTLSRSQTEEVMSKVGEALAFIWGGIPISPETILQNNFSSMSASADYLLITLEGTAPPDMELGESGSVGSDVDMRHVGVSREDAREMIIRKLFDDLLFSGRKDEKLAGTLWLLSLVTYVGQDRKIQSLLPEIQEAFLHSLGDKNEDTLDIASKGMSIVYQLGRTRMKERLVEALVSSLSGVSKKRRTSANIKPTGESEAQEESPSVGTPPGGGGFLSTYKELCTIASELGQPELLYKFVAVLTSRRGTHPGFAMIAKKACDELQPHVSPLVPKLYRYQYDPNKGIQESMLHIWRALVDDPKKTVDAHLGVIIEDLLLNGGARSYRFREAACLALADVFQGRKFTEVSPFLERTWSLAIRALDDLKETVRNAAGVLCRTLRSLTVRLSDRSLTSEKDVEQCLEIVLPFLLNKGIMSDAAAVRKHAVDTLTKIVKGAGPKIRAQMPDLVACMLESLTNLEDTRLNYVEMHADRLNMSTEKLQNARISIAKDSPMWETLGYCAQQIDGTMLSELVPKLTQIVRSGVGLNTRAGVAKFICMVCQKVTSDIRPHSGTLLKVLLMAMQKEKSAPVCRGFAAACANVAKYATEARFAKLVEDSLLLYSVPGDAESRFVSAALLRELSRQAADALRAHHTDLLPTAFLARFDEEKDVKTMFTEVWEESSGGNKATLQLYIEEITQTLRAGLALSNWTRKHQASRAIIMLADELRDGVSLHRQQLLSALLAELPGRIWEGKEAVLEAIGAVCAACPVVGPTQQVTADDPSIVIRDEDVLAAIVASCKRPKATFQEAAFLCLNKVLKAFKGRDLFAHVEGLLLDPCRGAVKDASTRQSSSSLPGSTEERAKEPGSVPGQLLIPVLNCLVTAWESAGEEMVTLRGKEVAIAIASAMEPLQPWTVRLAALSGAQTFAKKFGELYGSLATMAKVGEAEIGWMDSLILPALECTEDMKISQVRSAALEFLKEALRATSNGENLPPATLAALRARVEAVASSDRHSPTMSLAATILSECLARKPGGTVQETVPMDI